VLDHLACLACGAVAFEQAEDIEVQLIKELGCPGTEGYRVSVDEHRDRDNVGPDDKGRRGVAERDLRR